MENHPCFKIFQEIMYHNSRLAVLGVEAIKVLDLIKVEGVQEEVLEPFVEVANKAAEAETTTKKEVKEKDLKRCKWWNRGYCREKEGCSFSHPAGDCQDHLQGGCHTKGCRTLRHRKICKYFDSRTGCYRGENCEYLHVKKRTEKINGFEDKIVNEKQAQTEPDKYLEDKETQTEKEGECICKAKCESSKVYYDKDKVICIMKRAHCSDEEWDEYEDKVESEMDISELLEDLGKVLEAADRVSNRIK